MNTIGILKQTQVEQRNLDLAPAIQTCFGFVQALKAVLRIGSSWSS